MAVLARFPEIWRRHRLLSVAFLCAATLTVFFLGRLVVSVVYWSAHREEPVRPWMTVGYVGRSWDLPPRRIDELAGLPPPDGHPLTLQEIADRRGVAVETVIAEVEAAVRTLRREAAEGAGP